ncbi:MAG TPA: orotate phosphoribosyltransferase, partial [Acidimicrobiales bacterium]|nr:orotate phosphoribosyltransferase [Acidimicrobiales bacterium]
SFRASAGQPDRERLCRVILERGYHRSEKPFMLSSGGTSRDYVDLRRALSRGPDLGLAAALVVELALERVGHLDAAGGLTMGADPLAHAVALLAGCDWFSVRKQAKSHGGGRRIEGADLGPGRDVLLLEDTVSTGTSILAALDAVRETGARVVLACAVLDRADVAEDAFATRGVPFVSLLTYRDLGIEPLRIELPGVNPSSVEPAGDAGATTAVPPSAGAPGSTGDADRSSQPD